MAKKKGPRPEALRATIVGAFLLALFVFGIALAGVREGGGDPPPPGPYWTLSPLPPSNRLEEELIRDLKLYVDCEDAAKRRPETWDEWPCNKFPKPSPSETELP